MRIQLIRTTIVLKVSLIFIVTVGKFTFYDYENSFIVAKFNLHNGKTI